jgi:glutathione S-transferase
MKLYYSPGVCSLASHIILREIGLNFELDLVDKQTKMTASGKDFRSINPNGYVPVLELSDGRRLTEGPAIMQYLADLKPKSGLAPAAGDYERYVLQSWLNFITSEIHKGFSPLFKQDLSLEAKDVLRQQLESRLGYVAEHLRKQEYVMAYGFTIADAYLFVTTGWSPFVGVNLSKWPSLVEFRSRIETRPAVKAALIAEGLLR